MIHFTNVQIRSVQKHVLRKYYVQKELISDYLAFMEIRF